MTRSIDLSDLLEEDSVESIKTALTASAALVSSPKLSRGLAVTSVALGVARTGYRWYRSRKTRPNFRIRITDKDPLYNAVQEWLIKALPYDEQKNLIVASRQSTGEYSDVPRRTTATVDKDLKVLDLYYDGERRQEITIGGHKVAVIISEGENSPSRAKQNNSGNSSVMASRSVVIDCATLEAREAVLETLREEARKSYVRRPKHYAATRWASFRASSDVPVRPIESVVLRSGQRESIIGGLTTFLSQEEKYVKSGMPWHMGLLFYGPPGSGKTSIATAIAHNMNLDVYTIPLSSIEDDTSLFELLSEVSPRSILLLEDIDVASAATDRSDERRGVTLSGLLNALDGIATPHGIITIMTTNHFENLDDALFRSGRVDVLEEIGYVNDEQIEGLCKQFLGHIPADLPKVTDDDMIVAADIVAVFKKNLSSPELNDLEVIGAINAGKAKAAKKRAKKGSNNVRKTQPPRKEKVA